MFCTRRDAGKIALSALSLARAFGADGGAGNSRRSANLLAPAPKGASVLFDGSDLSHWVESHERFGNFSEDRRGPFHFKLIDRTLVIDPALRAHPHQECYLSTRQSHGDCLLHVEFWLPLMADAVGQDRANSGVYLQGRYEVQILDSYRLPPDTTSCGSIYGVAAPIVTASFAPEQWQSYDIRFRAARFRGEEVTEYPRITVFHNGVKIHDNVQIGVTTTNSVPEKQFPRMGPVVLQNHWAAVRFRNIWLVPEVE